MSKLDIYTAGDLADLTLVREGETKLGQKMHTISALDELASHPAKFVLIGLPEDVGVRANAGQPGTAGTWAPTLKAFCNIQSTDKLSGEEILVLGHLDFTEEMMLAEQSKPEQLRELVKNIDTSVSDLLKQIFAAGKVPIVIGGGHNNAYPILKALSQTHNQGVNALNIDAHADFRALEGRHSGNGFSYAFAEGYLHKYAIWGLHENYNSQALVQQLNAHPDRISYTFFEDFLTLKTDPGSAFDRAMQFVQGIYGLELDLDSIAGVSASAATTSGFTAEHIRSVIYQTRAFKPAYFHICEGIAENQHLLPKLISFFISDFIKSQI
jgi:formiminoglutamase